MVIGLLLVILFGARYLQSLARRLSGEQDVEPDGFDSTDAWIVATIVIIISICILVS
jgi:hypothetical protein